MAQVGGARPPAAPPANEPKKGEVNELRALLRSVNTGSDNKKKRDVIRKVIAFMTLGIDVSRLFADMVMACNTRDLVVKKMVYLYLCAHAHSNPELTLLAINTLQKDCRDEDPMVRGLALRSLTSLRLPSILEYVLAPLKAAFTDSSGYVRQAGVIGVVKVYHLSPSTVKDGEYVDLLYGMIRDREPQVVINCLTALNEILAEEGGVAINQALVLHLLGRMREFTDWGQCVIMDVVVSRYTPANDDELFGIMNLLDPCLKVANSAVVLACLKAFLSLTKALPELQLQVHGRLKAPLLSLLASSSNEVGYAILSHLALIVDRAPGVYDDEYKQFFCKFNEPTCCKQLKMELLPKVANPGNARDICMELTEYVTGVDAELSRQAVRAIAEIALRVPAAVDGVVEALLDLVDMDAEYVRAETTVALQDLLRKFPDRAPAVLPSLHRCLKRMEDAAGKAAVIWMVGEYGQLIDDAPYLLEPLIDGIKEEDSVQVRMELLTATCKLFFKRPPEVQKMMGRLFKACLEDVPAPPPAASGAFGSSASSATSGNPLVHDRALLYYRLLRSNVREAAAVINGADRPPITQFLDDQAADIKERIWQEFNTLSVIYNKPADAFISHDHLVHSPAASAPQNGGAGGLGARSSVAASDDGLLASGGGSGAPSAVADDDIFGGGAFSSSASAPAPAPAAGGLSAFDDDLLGLGFGGAAPAAAPAPAGVTLTPGIPLEPAAFQGKWGSLPVALSSVLRAGRPGIAVGDIDAAVRAGHLSTIASGDMGSAIKLYAYGASLSPAGPRFHLLELVYDKAAGAANVTIKSEGGAEAGAAAAAIVAVLRAVPFM